VFRASGAVFDPSAGFSNLFVAQGRGSLFYSILLNAILAY